LEITLHVTRKQPTFPFNDDTSLCFGFNESYRTLLGIGNRSI